MKTALFTNWTDREFIGAYNGKSRTYKAGQSEWMPDHLARHFAKHLTNRELLRTDVNGNLIYKNGDKMTSPKKPEEVPIFMELFNKAYTPDENEDVGDKEDDLDALITSANKNRAEKSRAGQPDAPATPSADADPNGTQVVLPPDFNDQDDEESSFENKPVDPAIPVVDGQ